VCICVYLWLKTNMNILFITASRIGDAVLSTGLLDQIAREYPAARVTVVCGPLAGSLFEGYPNLERLILLSKKKRHGHWIDLWKQVIGTRWDMVVDLRNSAVSRLIFAKRRYIFGAHIDRGLHKVAQNAAVMRLANAPAPRLWFTAAQSEKAAALVPSGDAPVLGVGPAANWRAKTWPEENFIAVINALIAPDGLMPHARVAVFAAPGEEAVAYEVLRSIPDGRGIDVIAKGSPAEAAAAIARCDFYIGNDSGLMHCAAAAGVPTLGLFGPSYPHLYSPWGDHAAYVSTPESFDELIAYEGYKAGTAPSLMRSLSVESVMHALQKMMVNYN
jgi:heptosyltransferase-3